MTGSDSSSALRIPVIKPTTAGNGEHAPYSSGRGAIALNLSQPVGVYTPTQSRRGSGRSGSVHGSAGGGLGETGQSFNPGATQPAFGGSARGSPAPQSVRSNRSQGGGLGETGQSFNSGATQPVFGGSARGSPAPQSVRSNRSGMMPMDAKPPSARSNRMQEESAPPSVRSAPASVGSARSGRGVMFGGEEMPPSARSNRSQAMDRPPLSAHSTQSLHERRASSKPPTPLSAKNNESALSRDVGGGTPMSRAAGDMLEPQEKAGSARASRRASELSYQASEAPITRTATHGNATLDDDAPAPPRRTLRRMYSDKSEHINDYNFLRGIERPPSSWQPVSSSRETTFHQGFYRKKVTGQDAERSEAEAQRQERAAARAAPRRDQLAEHSKHHFLREDPVPRGQAENEIKGPRGGTDECVGHQGRMHFQNTSNIIIAGPESVIPRGPDTEGKRMQGLLREGMAKERTESVKDVFTHMFGYSSNDIIRAD